jgi:hypothetical protein
MLESFIEDFQEQAFDESQFSLWSSKASALDHFTPISPIYSIEIELHVRSNHCTNLC